MSKIRIMNEIFVRNLPFGDLATCTVVIQLLLMDFTMFTLRIVSLPSSASPRWLVTHSTGICSVMSAKKADTKIQHFSNQILFTAPSARVEHITNRVVRDRDLNRIGNPGPVGDAPGSEKLKTSCDPNALGPATRQGPGQLCLRI